MSDAKLDAGQITTIRIQKTTRDLLAEIGSYRESLDDIVLRLIKFWNEHKNND